MSATHHEEFLMLIFAIAGGVAAVLFLAAVMTGIEGNDYR
jgi:hypothetical protein